MDLIGWQKMIYYEIKLYKTNKKSYNNIHNQLIDC